jgi:hypothetical protein
LNFIKNTQFERRKVALNSVFRRFLVDQRIVFLPLGMQTLKFIFQLGVLFAIFGFLFFLFEWIIKAFLGKASLGKTYVVKAIKYVILVNVTFLFCLDRENGAINYMQLGTATLVLLFYFLGRFQNQQKQAVFLKRSPMQSMSQLIPPFDMRMEIGVVLLAILIFLTLIFQPVLANHSVAQWFHATIKDIGDTPVIGFIFDVIGFFFMLSVVTKMVQGVLFLLSGKAFSKNNTNTDDEHFDDFEEMEED